jgi:hypothetical protein
VVYKLSAEIIPSKIAQPVYKEPNNNYRYRVPGRHYETTQVQYSFYSPCNGVPYSITRGHLYSYLWLQDGQCRINDWTPNSIDSPPKGVIQQSFGAVCIVSGLDKEGTAHGETVDYFVLCRGIHVGSIN